MAPLTTVHLNSTGERTPVALFAGATRVVAVVMHAAPVATIMVNGFDTPEGQSPKRASTTQLIVPFGTGAVSCVAVVAPMRKRSEVELFVAGSAVEPKMR